MLAMIQSVKKLVRRSKIFSGAYGAEKAYDLWSEDYDDQPDNLMLQLDEKVFAELLKEVVIENKVVADIGCGTGRHWPKLYARKPSAVVGFDVSSGMLEKLRQKFPMALVHQSEDHVLSTIPDDFAHCLISTLTIAHIENVSDAIGEWARVLRPGGDLLITDFHPQLLAEGGRRSFQHRGKALSVVNHIHPLPLIRRVCHGNGLRCVAVKEIIIDEHLKPFYEKQKALGVYQRYYGRPVIYGMHLRKPHAPR